MSVSRRSFVFVALLLAGCNTRPPSPDQPTQPITLGDVFAGRAGGGGHFRLKHVHTEWRFRVRSTGRQQGDTLVSQVDYVYADGTGHSFDWRFVRLAPGLWTGHHSNSIGEAEIVENGSEIRMQHTAMMTGPQHTYREQLSFSDVIYRRADGQIVVDSIVSRGSVRFANMRLVLAQG